MGSCVCLCFVWFCVLVLWWLWCFRVACNYFLHFLWVLANWVSRGGVETLLFFLFMFSLGMEQHSHNFQLTELLLICIFFGPILNVLSCVAWVCWFVASSSHPSIQWSAPFCSGLSVRPNGLVCACSKRNLQTSNIWALQNFESNLATLVCFGLLVAGCLQDSDIYSSCIRLQLFRGHRSNDWSVVAVA